MTSYDPRVTIFFGDGDYEFALPLAQRFEVERLVGKRFAAISPDMGLYGALPSILTRIGQRLWFGDDLREVLRLGLIGGGMSPKDAKQLVDTYGPGARSDEECLEPVMTLLNHTLFPPEDLDLGDRAKKAMAGEGSAPATSDSLPPTSTESAEPSG